MGIEFEGLPVLGRTEEQANTNSNVYCSVAARLKMRLWVAEKLNGLWSYDKLTKEDQTSAQLEIDQGVEGKAFN